MTTPPTVTQIDRDAAADMYRRFRYGVTTAVQENIRHDIEHGQRDDDPIVQVFARHRETATRGGEGETDLENRAWDWIDATYANIEAGDDPNDRDYGPDDLVDAYSSGFRAAPTPAPQAQDTRGGEEDALDPIIRTARVKNYRTPAVAQDTRNGKGRP